ncbi:venom acid phosphatase Acph-1-like isoform X2 [Diabrotica virgifera virgifera]|uniref:acid phosphatase n=1 Tax=Diabrotica virgifera virgifera TaxID=50390 RepID=A0A6P7GID1_DIAVI|nr:venom acid phosphatase Acph-1-like isoform X2 [Diabrotica virgifera virgifera]
MFRQVQLLALLFSAAFAASGLSELDQAASDQLVAVVQLFRHGHRTPTEFYKNDQFSDSSKYWSGLDLGQLTNIGKQMHYELGQFTRKRYGKWLPQKYDKADFYAQTTNVDRTHMSGQANLYALYPAKGDQLWRRQIDWQPIPLHPADSNIWETFPSCAAYITEYAKVLASDVYTAIDKEYAGVYAYLSQYSGENITTLSEATTVFDCFKSESTAGLRLPWWASKVYPEPLTQLTGYYFHSLAFTTKLQRLYAGTLLNSILSYFDNKINGSVTQQFKMYSGHDTNVAAVLSSLNAFNPPSPPEYASSVYIELRNISGYYFVNVWSKDGSNFKKVSIRGCALDCPLEEVRQRLNEIILDVDTRTEECSSATKFETVAAKNMYKKLIETGEIERIKNKF